MQCVFSVLNNNLTLIVAHWSCRVFRGEPTPCHMSIRVNTKRLNQNFFSGLLFVVVYSEVNSIYYTAVKRNPKLHFTQIQSTVRGLKSFYNMCMNMAKHKSEIINWIWCKIYFTLLSCLHYRFIFSDLISNWRFSVTHSQSPPNVLEQWHNYVLLSLYTTIIYLKIRLKCRHSALIHWV